MLVSENKPLKDWVLPLTGLDLEDIWENAIAQIGGIDISDGKDLDATIVESDRRDKLAKRIEALEKRAMGEKQPRRKWELSEEVRKLKESLELRKESCCMATENYQKLIVWQKAMDVAELTYSLCS